MLRYVQIAAAVTHLGVLAVVVGSLFGTHADSLYQAPWFALFWPDLPATALLVLSWVTLPEGAFVRADQLAGSVFGDFPMASFSLFWWPLLIYLPIGTWWWWIIPRIAVAAASALAAKVGALHRRAK